MKNDKYNLILIILLNISLVLNVYNVMNINKITQSGWERIQDNNEQVITRINSAHQNTRDTYQWLTSEYCDAYVVQYYCPEVISLEDVKVDPLLLNFCKPIPLEGTYPEVCE